jgi:HEAT repeat protein
VDAILGRFEARDPIQRRAAAEALAKQADAGRLPARVLARVGELCATENDALVWQGVLAAIAADGSDEAAGLAYLAIGNRSPEVRRRACQYLEAHGDPRHVPALLPALDDESGAVTLAAIKALGAVGKLDDPRPLVNLLASSEKQVRIEAGVALARGGATQGAAALERLAIDADPETRLRAAKVMGELADAEYLPTLMALLADRSEIQRAALHSLAQVAPAESATALKAVDDDGIPLPPSEQVRRWQRWYESRTADAREPSKP